MNWKTTLALLILVGVGGVLAWYGPHLPPALDPAPKPPAAADAGTRAELEKLDAARFTRIEVRRGDRVTVLERKGDGAWSLPGNWATRTAEAQALAERLASLRTRFDPYPIAANEDLAGYGLNPPTLTVEIRAGDQSHRLAFGEPVPLFRLTDKSLASLREDRVPERVLKKLEPLTKKEFAPGETFAAELARVLDRDELANWQERVWDRAEWSQEEKNRFEWPTWLRLNDRPEVLRLPPGLVAQLDRPADYYQQRRLFPGERVAKDAEATEMGERPGARGATRVERLTARGVTIEDKKGGQKPFTLVHTREGSWELQEPVRDRLEARTRDALLAAVPDLWAEQFVNQDSGAVAGLPAAGAAADPWAALLAAYWATPQGLLVKSGLQEPERILTVTRGDGEPVTLLIGRASGSRARKVVRPAPPGLAGFEQRDREETVFDEYRYARLKGNPQVFEIKADKLKDVFVTLDALREPQVAPFTSADARRLEIVQGGEKIVLARENDRWKLLEPVQADAENGKVTELLDRLSGLRAREKDIIDKEDPKKYGFDKDAPVVTVTVLEETREKDTKGEKIKKERVLTVRLGKHDAEAKKLYVQADDWPRINAVDDALDALVRRPALAYRGKRVFDFSTSQLAKVEVRRGSGTFTLERTGDGWRLVSPVKADADAGKLDRLAGDLSNLEVLEYVNDAPRADRLEAQYGLGKPALVVRLEFSDKAKPARTLEVGKARGSKPGYFARLADVPDRTTPVFVIPNDMHAALDRDALAYRPTQLWQVPAEDVTALHIQRGKEEEYSLKRDNAGWKLSGPFEAPALALAVQSLAAELAAPQALAYKAHEAKDLAPYGLDKPALRLGVATRDGKQHTLLVGGPADKETPGRCAKLADSPAIFIVAESLVHAADHAALDLLDPVLLRLDPARVERVRGKVGDAVLTLERKGEEWRVTDAPGSPFTADAEVVAGLQKLWSELHADRFAAYGKTVAWAKYGLDKPAVTVTVTVKPAGKGPAEHVIELGAAVEGTPEGRYARVDKGAGVAVLGAATARTLAQTSLDYVNRNVLKFDAAAVRLVQRHMGANVLEVAKKDDGWQLLKPAEERADDKAVQDLLAQLSELRARRVAAYPLTELQPFGLDRPAALWTIKLNGERKPSEHVLKIGKAVEGGGGERFVQVDGGPVAAVLPAALAERLVARPLAFRDRNLVRFADADKARLDRGPRHAVFARPEGTWKLTEPLQADADQDELDDFINALARLRADALVAEKPGAEELKKYGLDRPEARWRLESGDKEVLHLLVGNAEENGPRRYARLANRDLVFLLDPRLSGKVLGEYRPRAVWTPTVDALQVESLRYHWAHNPFELEKSAAGDSWQVSGKPEVKVNAEAVKDVLAALRDLKLARYVVDKGADPKLFGLDKPDLVLVVATRGGRKLLEVGGFEGGSKRRYARVPGPDRSDVFLIDEAECGRIFRDLAGFTRASPPAPPSGPASEK
jgi:hypothetical protein